MRRQTCNGAQFWKPVSGAGAVLGALGELARQVSTGAMPRAGTRPRAPDGSWPPGGIWSVGLHLGETDGRKENAYLSLTLLPLRCGLC